MFNPWSLIKSVEVTVPVEKLRSSGGLIVVDEEVAKPEEKNRIAKEVGKDV